MKYITLFYTPYFQQLQSGCVISIGIWRVPTASRQPCNRTVKIVNLQFSRQLIVMYFPAPPFSDEDVDIDEAEEAYSVICEARGIEEQTAANLAGWDGAGGGFGAGMITTLPQRRKSIGMY